MPSTISKPATPEQIAAAAEAVRAFLTAYDDMAAKLDAIAAPEGPDVRIAPETLGITFEAGYIINELFRSVVDIDHLRRELEGFVWLAETPDQ